MPILKNAKHEAFAQGLADGKSQERAYVDAGYAKQGARAHASTLLKQNRSILKRRDEVLSERDRLHSEAMVNAARVEKVTLASHLAMLAALRDEARAAGKYQAAIAAEVSRGKACGLYIDRTELGAPGQFDHLSDAELDAELEALQWVLDRSRRDVSIKKDTGG